MIGQRSRPGWRSACARRRRPPRAASPPSRPRHEAGLALALCLARLQEPRTEVVVVVSSFDLVIPRDLDRVHVSGHRSLERAPTGVRFDSQDVPLCPGSSRELLHAAVGGHAAAGRVPAQDRSACRSTPSWDPGRDLRCFGVHLHQRPSERSTSRCTRAASAATVRRAIELRPERRLQASWRRCRSRETCSSTAEHRGGRRRWGSRGHRRRRRRARLLPPPGSPAQATAAPSPSAIHARHTPQACYGGAAGTCGIGACRPGVQYCLDGQWGPCVGEVDPQPEVCDGRDQDCNGSADDGLGTVSCGLGETANTVAACTAGKPTVVQRRRTASPRAATARTTTATAPSTRSAARAIHVAPSRQRHDRRRLGALPFRTIGQGITAAAALASGPKLVYAASGATCPSQPQLRRDRSPWSTASMSTAATSRPTGRATSPRAVATVTPKPRSPTAVTFDVNIVAHHHPRRLHPRRPPPAQIIGSKGAIVSNVIVDPYAAEPCPST